MEAVVENKQIETKSRIDYLEIAKFLGIILVILGHTTGNFDTPMYRLIIYSFHMPLFFIVSGLVLKISKEKYNLKHWLSFLKKNALMLVVPYFIWALVFCTFSYKCIPGILYGSYESIVEVGTLTSLWYIPALFTARIYCELIFMLSTYLKKLNKNIFIFIIAIVFFTAGFLIPHPAKGLFWSLDVALIVAAFMLIGYLLKPIIKIFYDKPIWFHVIVNIVMVILLTGGIAIQGEKPTLVLICKMDFGNIGLFLLNSFAGSFMIISLAVIISKLFNKHQSNIFYKLMLWIGCNTLGIYLIHKNFLQEICMANFAKIVPLPNLGYAILGTIITLIFCVIMVFIIDKIIPQLFGKFPAKKEKSLDTITVSENELTRKDNNQQE